MPSTAFQNHNYFVLSHSIKENNVNGTNRHTADRPLFLRGNTEFHIKINIIKMIINILLKCEFL